MSRDPQLLAEAEKAKLEIDPIDGPGIEKMVNGSQCKTRPHNFRGANIYAIKASPTR